MSVSNEVLAERLDRVQKELQEEKQERKTDVQRLNEEVARYKSIFDKGKGVGYVLLMIIGFLSSILILRDQLIKYFT